MTLEPSQESIAVDPGGTLYVDLDHGAVEVESHDAREVSIETEPVREAGRPIAFSLEKHGNDVELAGRLRSWLRLSTCMEPVRVRARVPRDYSVDVRTRFGRVRVAGVTGRVAVSSQGGSIDVRGIRGPVLLRGAAGRIRAEDVTGPLRARSTAGSIELRAIDGEADASAVAGRIDVRIPEGAGALLDARCLGGSVSIGSDLRVDGVVHDDRAKGEINGGGELLRLRTAGAGIRVRTLAVEEPSDAGREGHGDLGAV